MIDVILTLLIKRGSALWLLMSCFMSLIVSSLLFPIPRSQKSVFHFTARMTVSTPVTFILVLDVLCIYSLTVSSGMLICGLVEQWVFSCIVCDCFMFCYKPLSARSDC